MTVRRAREAMNGVIEWAIVSNNTVTVSCPVPPDVTATASVVAEEPVANGDGGFTQRICITMTLAPKSSLANRHKDRYAW